MLVSPDLLIERSTYDPIGDVLRLSRARCELVSGFSASGRWSLAFQPQQPLKITVQVRGHSFLQVDGADPLALAEGDIAILNSPSAVVQYNDRALSPRDALVELGEHTGEIVSYRRHQPMAPPPRVAGLGHDVIMGGHIALDRTGLELMNEAFAPTTHIAAEATSSPLRWIMDRLLTELGQQPPGAGVAADHLAQLLFVEVLRTRLHQDVEGIPPGWLRAAADQRLSAALTLMHRDPRHQWTLDQLAHVCGMSRTSFATAFRATVGRPAIAYLTQLRMRLAAEALRDRQRTIADVANAVGYSSEAAFNHAFKRYSGSPPRRFTQDQQA
jgi:AraC-like DNA-binding protein